MRPIRIAPVFGTVSGFFVAPANSGCADSVEPAHSRFAPAIGRCHSGICTTHLGVLRRTLVIPLLCLSAVGCSPIRTDIHSFVDPDYHGRIFQRVLVAPTYDDLGLRAAAEQDFIAAFGELSEAVCLPSVETLLPTRDYDEDEMFAAIGKTRADAVLVIHQTDRYDETQYVPETTTIDSTEYLRPGVLRRGYGFGYGSVDRRATVRRSGGYYLNLPRVRHELRLFDVSSRKLAWFATSRTEADHETGLDALEDCMAEAATKRLVEDGMIPPRVKVNDHADGEDSPGD